MPVKNVNNSEDILDSRDIIEYLDELEGELADFLQESEESDELTEEDFNDYEELEALRKLVEEGSDAADWQYGVTLIRDNYWVEYCEDLVKDIGDLPSELPSYIERNINWEGVAEDLQQDYFEVDYDGITYWVR